MESAATKSNVKIFDDSEAVARAATEKFIELSRDAIADHGAFSVALAGGSTPKRVYELLASDEFKGQVDWSKVHIFFGDERTVPPDHSDSNFRMANEAMLSKVSIPKENIHRMKGEGDAAANAEIYDAELRSFFKGGFKDGENFPRFDLIMLGMGDDGHTASLFPGSEALKEQTAWVVSNWVEKFNTFRITLSAPAINNARHVMFIITGAGKADRLPEVINGARDTNRLPSQLIRPTNGELVWYVDRAAAAKL